MKNFLSILLAIAALAIGFFVAKNQFKSKQPTRTEQAEIIVEKIEEVSKLISLEGSFAEVYKLDQTQRLFFDLIPIPKKAIVIAKAKVFATYDLNQLEYDLNEKEKVVTIKNVPEPQLIVEPNLEFYDLQANIIPFSEKELSLLNQRATQLLKEEAQKEEFLTMAKKNLELNLQNIILVAKSQGWTVQFE